MSDHESIQKIDKFDYDSLMPQEEYSKLEVNPEMWKPTNLDSVTFSEEDGLHEIRISGPIKHDSLIWSDFLESYKTHRMLKEKTGKIVTATEYLLYYIWVEIPASCAINELHEAEWFPSETKRYLRYDNDIYRATRLRLNYAKWCKEHEVVYGDGIDDFLKENHQS